MNGRGRIAALLLATALAIVTWGALASADDVSVYFRGGTPTETPNIVFSAPGPEVTLIPHTHVYYVQNSSNYDVYKYNGNYYVYDNGYWYQANSVNGPWTYTTVRSVPYQVVSVPTTYRTHWAMVPSGERVTGWHYRTRTTQYTETTMRVKHHRHHHHTRTVVKTHTRTEY
jgi:hypothetical protein